MANNKAYILLDRSGSMASMWSEALGGINGYVRGLKNADVMLAAFDTVGYDVIRNCSIDDWKNITDEEIQPRGGTPLVDAACRMIHNILDSGSKRAILVVVTDGEENASQKFNSIELKSLTKQLTQKEYEIVFLGANFDKIGEVAKTSFGYSDMSRIVPTSVKGFGSIMNSTMRGTNHYFSTGAVTQNFYSDEDKAEAKKQ